MKPCQEVQKMDVINTASFPDENIKVNGFEELKLELLKDDSSIVNELPENSSSNIKQEHLEAILENFKQQFETQGKDGGNESEKDGENIESDNNNETSDEEPDNIDNDNIETSDEESDNSPNVQRYAIDSLWRELILKRMNSILILQIFTYFVVVCGILLSYIK